MNDPVKIGDPVPRREDRRLLTGRGHYVGDIAAPDSLHLAFARSPHAHARITGVDLDAARRAPGVVAVWDAAELSMPDLPAFTMGDRFRATPQPALADGRVLFVGQPVVAVLAVDRYRAEDACDLVDVSYEPLPPVLDPRFPDAGPPLHGGSTNVVGENTLRQGEGRSALRGAAHVVSVSLRLGRVVGNPMEPRAVLVSYDESSGRLEVQAATQGVFGLRRSIAQWLSLEERQVHVSAPDIGGGFGLKNRLYPEDAVASAMALRLRLPVRWTGDRQEEFLATNQERDQYHEAQIGVDGAGRIVAVVDDYIQDGGAFCAAAAIPFGTTAISIPGPYRIPHLDVHGTLVATNKVPVGPYRGAGRPQGNFVMERLLDAAADALNIDRIEIRRRNLITPEDLPYETASHIRYDHGNFPAMLRRAEGAIDHPRFRERQQAARDAGRRIGLGVVDYVELSAGGGFEDAVYRLLPGGIVEVSSGSSSQGQGHETAFAQVVSERLGLPLEQIVIREADTDRVTRGVGTFGSRSMTISGNALADGAEKFKTTLLEEAARRLEASIEDLTYDSGTVSVQGVPVRSVTLRELAGEHRIEATGSFTASGQEYAFGVHAVTVEVDAETGLVKLLDYLICHDAGRTVNPLLADGQTIGGTVQGLGTVMYEELGIDGAGQPENASLMDYLMPSAADMPVFTIIPQDYRSTGNPEGFKGLAEGGTIPPMAAVLSAVEDALGPGKIHLRTLPLKPDALLQAMG
jgi:carbon-monoxide dehydrogenase large subunit